MAATFAAMILLYTLFAKFVPIISIWEMKAGLPSRMDPRCWPRRGCSRRASAPSLRRRVGPEGAHR